MADVIQLNNSGNNQYPQAAIPIGLASTSGATLPVPKCDMLITTMHHSETSLRGMWFVAWNGSIQNIYGGNRVTITANLSSNNLIQSLTISTTAGTVRVCCIPLTQVT